ncbi:twin-arginine translocase subunit TatC [Actinoalloteichus spitiensis]|uniref:twin-arginine translocase subunit TatC n=1 Tax=Actinoalloteichus spitiensis TaxID=252394 RepID=UPI0003640FBE|nr:twin-arginine translocase subunit TatC [Actinoalloteichus spitiensis]
MKALRLVRTLSRFRRRGIGRRWGRRANPDGTMPLMEHLYELRYRLTVAFAALVVTTVLGFLWFTNSVWVLPSLGELLTAPYCALPTEIRFEPNDGQCQLMQTAPFEVFMLQLKVAFAAGLVLGSPIWLYQIWAFITPGLYAKERKFAGLFVGFASVLFAVGAVLAYNVAPQGLRFMTSFGGDQFFTSLTGGEYIGFVLLLLMIFGISFELPLLVVMLNFAGVLPFTKIKSWWRGIIFSLFCFAALVTPGQDPVSMVVLALALCLLFGAASQIAWLHDRRKAKKLAAAGLAGGDLDEPSRLDLTPGAPEQATDSREIRRDYDDVT